MKTIVKLDDVSFSKNDKMILKNLNLNIRRGDYIGIVGANGAGKSTLLKLIINEKKATKGNIFLFGEEIEKFSRWDKLSYINQKSHSFRSSFPMTVKEFIKNMDKSPRNLTRKLGLYRHNKNKDLEEIEKILKEVELVDYKNRVLDNLKKHHNNFNNIIFFNEPIIDYPKIILIDEPVVGIEDKEKVDFYNILKKLNLEYNITIIIASHDIETITKVSRNVVAIKDSKIKIFDNKYNDTKDVLDYLYHKSIKKAVSK